MRFQTPIFKVVTTPIIRKSVLRRLTTTTVLVLFNPFTCLAQEEVAAGGAGALAIIGMIIAALGWLASMVAGIWFIVIAFTVHVGWGLACLFLPFASLVFLCMHWGRAWRAFVASALATVLLMAGLVVTFFAAPNLLHPILESDTMDTFAKQVEAELHQEMNDAQKPSAPPADDTPEVESPPAELKPSAVAQVPITKDAVAIGDSVAMVKHKLGRPTGEIQQGARLLLMYSGMTVIAEAGQVVEISGTPETGKTDTSASADSTRKKKFFLPKPKPKTPTSSAPAPRTSSVETIKQGGKKNSAQRRDGARQGHPC